MVKHGLKLHFQYKMADFLLSLIYGSLRIFCVLLFVPKKFPACRLNVTRGPRYGAIFPRPSLRACKLLHSLWMKMMKYSEIVDSFSTLAIYWLRGLSGRLLTRRAVVRFSLPQVWMLKCPCGKTLNPKLLLVAVPLVYECYFHSDVQLAPLFQCVNVT